MDSEQYLGTYKLCFKKNPDIESLANSNLFTVYDFGKTDTDLENVIPLGTNLSFLNLK